jgi:hypothetical protein
MFCDEELVCELPIVVVNVQTRHFIPYGSLPLWLDFMPVRPLLLRNYGSSSNCGI